jgi:hypothetical protein
MQSKALSHSPKSGNRTGPESRAREPQGSAQKRASEMQELWLLRDAIASLVVGATGAFWIIVAFYGVVSILFDDETPRGVPGIDYFYATRPHLRDPQN